MSKQVYISADYDPSNGDQAVVEELIKWGQDKLHKVDFIDMSNPSSGSVTIFYKGIMPSEKVLDLPMDCNTLTGSVNL